MFGVSPLQHFAAGRFFHQTGTGGSPWSRSPTPSASQPTSSFSEEDWAPFCLSNNVPPFAQHTGCWGVQDEVLVVLPLLYFIHDTIIIFPFDIVFVQVCHAYPLSQILLTLWLCQECKKLCSVSSAYPLSGWLLDTLLPFLFIYTKELYFSCHYGC